MIPVLAYAATHLDEDVSLAALAAQAGLSPFHLHRVFSATAGETPKQFTLRLRLGRAAVLLLASNDSILDVALACGFQSHEVFIRAFRQRFGIKPRAYRVRGFAASADRAQANKHAEIVRTIGPCVGLFQRSGTRKSQRSDMSYSISKKDISPQPVLIMRRRVKRTEIAATLAEVFGHIFLYAQRTGTALAGQPFTRIREWGPGLLTIDAGLQVVAAGEDASRTETGITADTLPAGPVATTAHYGPYEKLAEAHAAVQVWIEEQGLIAAGAPWEIYTTDPTDHPDPKDWRTDIFWPLAR